MSPAINAGLLPQTSGFDHGTFHVGYVVDEVALRHFSPSNSVLLCRYHPTNAPYSFSSQYCSCMRDKRGQPGNL